MEKELIKSILLASDLEVLFHAIPPRRRTLTAPNQVDHMTAVKKKLLTFDFHLLLVRIYLKSMFRQHPFHLDGIGNQCERNISN